MTPAREAIVLPLIFLSVTLAGMIEPGGAVTLAPASLFSLVLAAMVLTALVRCGALDPARLMHGSRGALANVNGLVVLATLFAASAQVLWMLAPRSGLPMFFVDVLLFVLLLNTLVATTDRVRLLRSLAVTLGSALVLKFVVLAALSSPGETRTARVLAALFDAATFGSIAQAPPSSSAGYLAFASVAAYLVGIALLPRPTSTVSRPADLVPR
jgi:hypothetical protein